MQARTHTSGSNDQGYNSSQAAVLAVWLMFLIYIANAIKSVFPLLQVPVWIFSISQSVTLTIAIKLTSMTEAVPVVVRLLETFLSGLGLGVGVSLVVFPMNCRTALFGSLQAYFHTMESLLDVQLATLNSLETEDPWFPTDETTIQRAVHKKTLGGLSEAATKLRGQQGYAESEIAIGNLRSSDIHALVNQVIRIIPALSGVAFVFDILASRSTELSLVQGMSSEKDHLADDVHHHFRVFHDGFDKLTRAMKEAIGHISIVLRLKKQASQATGSINPRQFLKWYEAQIQEFSKLQDSLVQLWTHRNCEALAATKMSSDTQASAPAPFALIYVRPHGLFMSLS